MKMTRLEWRYLKKIALDHPYFDTHPLPITEEEADAIVKANVTRTGKEFVDSIYAELGMTRPERKKGILSRLEGIKELFYVPPIRKLAIAVLVILLLTVFFAATPIGHAIAENVIQYIVTLFEDGDLAFSKNNESKIVAIDSCNIDGYNEMDENDDTEAYIFLNNFENFILETGKTPFVLPLPYTEVYYVYFSDIDYLELHSKYNGPEGMITTYQIWAAPDAYSFTLAGYTKYDSNESLFYSIEDNGNIAIIRFFEDSYLGLAATGHFSFDDLLEMLNYI